MIQSDIQSLEPDARVQLYIIDLNPIGPAIVYRYYPGVDANYGVITYQGLPYNPWPISIEGIEKQGTGPQNRPTLTVSNVTKAISIAIAPYQDIVGAKITRITTLAKYLDNGSSPDPAAFHTEVYYIDRKRGENKTNVQFELSTPLDFLNKKLPGRVIIGSTCPWVYKSSECSWPGTDPAKYFNSNGDAVGSQSEDNCGHRLSDCKKRFGDYAELPFGGFPSAGRSG